MDSIIVRTAARLLLPLMMLFSTYLLVRGHNAPGGGFIGGLVAAAGIALLVMGGGLRSAEAIVPAGRARRWIAVGLLLAGLSAVLPLFWGRPLMTGLWVKIPLPGVAAIEVGTPILFDVGVYIVVVGMVLTVILRLAHEVELWKL